MSANTRQAWLTVNEVASLLQTKPERIRHAIHRGELVAVTLSTDVLNRATYRIHPTELERWLKTRSTAKRKKPSPSRRRRNKTEPETVDFYA